MYAKKTQMSKSQQILNLYSSIVQPLTSHKQVLQDQQQNKSDNDVRKRLGAILLQNQRLISPYQVQRKVNKKEKVFMSIRLKNSKQQLDSDEEPAKKAIYSINSSCQLLPHSTSGLQYQTTTVTEQRQEENLAGVVQRTKRLLREYQKRLEEAECEKKQLQLEVEYWKSKSGY